MTIKDAAEKYNVSVQAVYQRLKRNNISVESLKSPDNKELTAEAEIIIDKLFNEDDSTKTPSLNQQNTELKNSVRQLNIELNSKQIEIESLRKRITELEQDKAYLQTALQQSQTVQLEIVNRMLPAGRETTVKKTFGDRLKSLFNR